MENGSKEENHRLGPAIEKEMVFPPTVSMRAYFSSYHLWAAKAFSASAGAIEANHSGPPQFDVAHRAYVNNSILSAVAFVEAAINEVFQDAADGHTSYTKRLGTVAISTLADYWNMTELKNKSHIATLDKYQLALRFCGSEPFRTDCPPYQDATLAIKLRNSLIHYKPESISSESEHKLSQMLRGKFESCKMLEGAGNPFFPDHCLGYGCSEWVIGSLKAYVDGFFGKLEVTPNYQAVSFGASQLGRA